MFPDSRLLKLAQKSQPWLVLTISLGFISGLLTILQARFISTLVSRVFLDGSGLSETANLLGGILLAFSLRSVLAWGSSLSAKNIAVQVKTRVQKLLIGKLGELGPSYLQGQQSGEISNTVVDGVEALDAYFSQYLPQLVISALVPLSILLFVFPMDVISGIVLLVTAPLIPYFMFLIGSSARRITDRQYSTLSRLAAQFLDSLQGLRTLKLFNQAQAQTEKIRATSDEYRRTTMKVLQVTFLSALVLELLATLSTAVVAVQIGLRLLYFRVTLEQALFTLIIAPEFYIPLRMLGLRFHAGMEGQSAAERIFQILDAKPFGRGSSQDSDQEPAPSLQAIRFRDVHFSYPGGRGPALRGIDLSIQRGQQVAVVGSSGAGKSTLVNLLLGFFSPDQGEIALNGKDLSKLDPDSWRASIAWVPQRPAIFQDTIAANIRLARPDADDGAVAAAAAAAHLADFIESLPEGYQTVIGEGGARLSGGQAQRLALARAFLKDAPLLVLDEPTSQLDPVTERQLADAVRRLMAGKTVITIAHRLNTVYQADRILVLQDGRIAAAGVHSELMENSPLYRNLVQAYTGYDRIHDLDLAGMSWLDEPEDQLPSADPPRVFQEEQQPSAPAGVIGRLLAFFKPYLREVLASALLGTLTIASSIGLMGASAWLIVTASTHPNIAVLQVAIVGVRFFGITRGVSRYAERLVSHNLTFKILTGLRVWFYKSLIPLAPARTSRYRAGDLLSRITSDVKTLEDFYVRSLAPPLVAILVGLGTGIFLYYYQPALALMLGSAFLISGLLVPLAVRRLAQKPGLTLVQSRANLTSQLVSYVQGLPDLLVYGQSEPKQKEMEAIRRRYSTAQLNLARIRGLNQGLLLFISNLGMWLTLILVIPQVRAGQIPGEMLAALALIALSAFEAVQPLPQSMETLASSREAGSRLMNILKAEPAVVDRPDPAPIPTGVSIQVKDLSFRYPESQRPALERIDFQLQEGELLAVVGPSGSGKTTLVNLLVRFWGDYQGVISLGEESTSLSDLSQQEIREWISAVPQNPDLFQTTLGANISLGRPGASQEEIASAARQARLDDLIAKLPDGLDTWLGERGQRFSAGEGQRIAIARAVLKDAPLFILDEPTANLDPITERDVLDTLFEILKGKTTLLITHRLVGLERADRILVLDRGRIIEQGKEDELLNRQGLYRTMWLTQNRILSYS